MKVAFSIMSVVVFAAFLTVLITVIKIFKGYRKAKKVDTSKVDAEIDRLLDFDITDKIYD